MPRLKTKIETENSEKLVEELSSCDEIMKFNYSDGNAVIISPDILHVSKSLRKMNSVKDFLIQEDMDPMLENVKEIHRRNDEPEHRILDDTFMCNRIFSSIDRTNFEGERCPFCNKPVPVLEVKELE